MSRVGSSCSCSAHTLGRGPAGVRSPLEWGTQRRLSELLRERAAAIDVQLRTFVFRYRSISHWLEVFRVVYGPMQKAFAALETPARAALTADLTALAHRFQRADDGTMVVPSSYLEVVATLR